MDVFAEVMPIFFYYVNAKACRPDGIENVPQKTHRSAAITTDPKLATHHAFQLLYAKAV